MTKCTLLSLAVLLLSGCSHNDQSIYGLWETELPGKKPLPFNKELVPPGKLIHKGTFTPDLQRYYYTISDPNFTQFDVWVSEFVNGKWTSPKEAFFNTTYNEHGMSFSPDGKSVYFSSTRPVGSDSIPDTWHLWKSTLENGSWSPAQFIDIPNLRNKLVSHPTIGNSGKLYFHASNLDYSEMDIYSSTVLDGHYLNATKVTFPTGGPSHGRCTPFISSDESYLIFAEINEQLEIMISLKNETGTWINPRKMAPNINLNSQGNPYVTPDDKYLFFTKENSPDDWSVYWVNIEEELASPQNKSKN